VKKQNMLVIVLLALLCTAIENRKDKNIPINDGLNLLEEDGEM
jgi:hypothetical protein